MPLPSFEVVARRRPVALVQPGTSLGRAPYVAVEGPTGRAGLVGLRAGGVEVAATWDGSRVGLRLDHDGRRSDHASRRHGRGRDPEALALTLTGDLATAFVREQGAWVARAVLDLGLLGIDTHDEQWLGELAATGEVTAAGGFGQLGLRDLRLVTHADGTAYDVDGRLLLSATSAGPGGFRSGHTSVWSLDPSTLELEHRSDLFFRRGGRSGVYGDHATHLVRDGDAWLVATSTWGDFDRERHPHVSITLATSTADLTTGRHVLDTRPLAVPTDGLVSVGTWDPHLVRTDEGWLVAFVSATRFFAFHPVLAAGPSLDALSLRAAASDRSATEGPTLLRPDGPGSPWRVLASDGRDGPRATRAGYPVLDLGLRQVGHLQAAYPTNLPWPTVVPAPDGWLLVGFDGTPYGGGLLGYGTHGDVVLQRASDPVSETPSSTYPV